MLEKIVSKNTTTYLRNFRKRKHFWNVPNERYSVYESLLEFCKSLKPSDKVLDIGAGLRPYEDLFHGSQYHSCDIENAFFDVKHDFTCSPEKIPVPNESYDRCLLIQVLEHVQYPSKTLNEVHRILKPNGLLFISVPQGAGDHFEPYHYFNMTQYGLKSLLNDSGFEIIYHYRLDGIFTYTANRIEKIGSIVASSYTGTFLLKPLLYIFSKFVTLVALFVSKFNFLDKKKNYCVENIMWARKIPNV